MALGSFSVMRQEEVADHLSVSQSEVKQYSQVVCLPSELLLMQTSPWLLPPSDHQNQFSLIYFHYCFKLSVIYLLKARLKTPPANIFLYWPLRALFTDTGVTESES